MRAIAAISVATFHFSAYYSWSNLTTSNFELGAQGVEIFYLISGFIIPYSFFHSAYKIRDFFRYIGKRLLRLIPPYITTIILINILGILWCYFLWGCVHDVNYRLIIVNLLFLADSIPEYNWINPIFATLKVEVQFYLLIGLIFPVFHFRKFIFPIFCIVFLLLGLYTMKYQTVFYNAPYFILGTALFYIKEKGPKIEFIIPVALTITTLFSFYLWEDLAAAIIGFCLLLFLPSNFKFLNFTGKISYSFYLIHGLAGGWFLYFTSPTEFGKQHPIIMIIFALLISWVVAFIVYFTIEKLSIKISKRIKYSK